MAYVLLVSLVRFCIYVQKPQSYSSFYWYTQLASAAIGYAVISKFWIFTLEGYPGARRVTYWLLPIMFLIIVWGRSLWHSGAPARSVLVEYERNMREAQAILLFVLILVILYYGIPVTRNLKGMLTGFAIYVSASMTGLAMQALGISGHVNRWVLVQPLAYLSSLSVWCIFLWSPSQTVGFSGPSKIDNNYLQLTTTTTTVIMRLRNYLTRAMKP